MSHTQAFFRTYGGYSILPHFTGFQLLLSILGQFFPVHLDVTRCVFLVLTASFVVFDVREAELLRRF